MNKACILAASMAAASTAALATASNNITATVPKSDKKISASPKKKARSVAEKEKRFTPRFDGLRFIETLVTAHR